MKKKHVMSGKASHRAGQVMVLTVLALGSTLLGATTIAGLLMLYELRQTTDLANSGRAIFAADAGLEWSLYSFSCAQPGSGLSPCPAAKPSFSNGATLTVTCADAAGTEVLCSDSHLAQIKSLGSAGAASRAFQLNF